MPHDFNTMGKYCPDIITLYTQIGENHLGNKSDEIQTKSIRRKIQAASGGNDPRARPEPGSGLPGHEAFNKYTVSFTTEFLWGIFMTVNSEVARVPTPNKAMK